MATAATPKLEKHSESADFHQAANFHPSFPVLDHSTLNLARIQTKLGYIKDTIVGESSIFCPGNLMINYGGIYTYIENVNISQW